MAGGSSGGGGEMVIHQTELLLALRDIYRDVCSRDGKVERKVKRLCYKCLGEVECDLIKEAVRIENSVKKAGAK